MFTKSAFALLLSSFVTANQDEEQAQILYENESFTHNMIRMIPVSSEFLQHETEDLTYEGSEQELVSVTGTYPCVFKVG
jgi:hypothetical protein